MGRGTQTPNFLYENPDAGDKIDNKDDYIRRNTNSTPDSSVRTLLRPLWRIRSHYRDTILPIQRNISEVQKIKPEIAAGTAAISCGDTSHPGIKLIIVEAAQSVRVYTAYLSKLRSLKANVEYVFHSYSLHATEMLEKFRETVDVHGMYSEDFSERIVCSLEMCLLLRSALSDSITTGQDVLACALGNLKEMATYYYVTKTSLLPSTAVQIQGYSMLKAYWNQFRREGREQDCVLPENVRVTKKSMVPRGPPKPVAHNYSIYF